jgi:transcriptional regulator with XRE-family HTH domain
MNHEAMASADTAEIAKQIHVFGSNLREARKRAGLTQVQLSVATPLDRAAISRLECGERAPDLPTLMRLCAALGVVPSDLVRSIGAKSSSRRSRNRKTEAPKNPAMVFGGNLKWARKRADISQERLALDAQVDRAAISVYENGGREPNLRTVLKLALKLEVRAALLLDGIA